MQSWLHIRISTAYESDIPYSALFTSKKAVLRRKIDFIFSSFSALSITCCGLTPVLLIATAADIVFEKFTCRTGI